jgi:hypothetical protein
LFPLSEALFWQKSMDLAKVLAELKRELANLDAAIVSLEKLQATGRKRGNTPRAEDDPHSQESEATDSSGAAAVRAREKGRPS